MAARRRAAILSLQMGLLAAIVGAWELASRSGLIDKFFFSQPSIFVLPS